MGRTKYALVIPQNEWNRLKRAAGPPEPAAAEGVSSEYVQGLIEKSQEWMRNWPDTVQGHDLLVAKEKERKRQKEKAMIKMFEDSEKSKILDNTETIQRARQMIFDNSCYGKQLLSALMESKVIEERDEQIKFKKELKQKAMKREKELETKNTINIGNNEVKLKVELRKKNKEFAEINKAMYEMSKAKIMKEKEKERRAELEDARLMKQLLDLEAQKKNVCSDKQGRKELEEQQKNVKERKARQEEMEAAIANVWRDYHERMRCKERLVMHEIHKDKTETPLFKKHYDLVQKLQEYEDKKYNTFVEKGIEQQEKRILKQEQIDIEKQKEEREKLHEEAILNKLCGEIQKEARKCDKQICDRESPFLHPHDDKVKKKPVAKIYNDKEKSKSFLGRSTKLMDDLKRRETEPTPWTALKGNHVHFAEQAGKTLRECRHKHTARKVVDNYRKINCLESNALPVSNY